VPHEYIVNISDALHYSEDCNETSACAAALLFSIAAAPAKAQVTFEECGGPSVRS